MFGVMAALHPVHIEIPRFEIDLLPPQRHEFRRAQSMAKHQQNNGGIAHPMAAGFARGLHHRFDLVWSKILAYSGVVFLFPGGQGPRLGGDFAENER
jgi:hypothetical protein